MAFSTGCAVFGESEAISQVADGTLKEDILAGVHAMLAERIMAMAGRMGLVGPCVVSGGGLNAGLVKSLAYRGLDLLALPHPQLVNAMGAAVSARQSMA